MKTLKLVDGDLSFVNGELAMIDGKEEIAQSLEIAIGTRLGEFFLDENVGLDTSNVLTKPFDENSAHDVLIATLMQDDRVEEVTDISFSRQGRTLTADISLVTTNGDPVSMSTVVIGG